MQASDTLIPHCLALIKQTGTARRCRRQGGRRNPLNCRAIFGMGLQGPAGTIMSQPESPGPPGSPPLAAQKRQGQLRSRSGPYPEECGLTILGAYPRGGSKYRQY